MTCVKPQPDPRGSKKTLRKTLLSARKALRKAEVDANSAEICDRLSASSYFLSADRIGIYAAIGNEVDLTAIARVVWESGRSLYLPIIDQPEKGHLMFGRWRPDDQLHPNRLGIAEPGKPRFAAAALDLLVIPIVGFDDDGNRIGMGGGFYDRTLSSMRLASGSPDWKRQTSAKALPFAVGVAHEIQRVAALAPDTWDQPLDAIVTEKGWQTPSTRTQHSPQ